MKAITLNLHIPIDEAIDQLMADPTARRVMIRVVIDELAETIDQRASRAEARRLVRALAEAEATARATNGVIFVPERPARASTGHTEANPGTPGATP